MEHREMLGLVVYVQLLSHLFVGVSKEGDGKVTTYRSTCDCWQMLQERSQ